MTTLFITEVGSYMWGMENETSDHDFFNCYSESTKKILRGEYIAVTKPNTKLVAKDTFYPGKCEYDEQSMEIEHLINLLVKGNINAMWAVMSPIVFNDNYGVLEKLRRIVDENPSSSIINSIGGMAFSQQKDAVKRAETRDPQKSLKTAYRTYSFGIEYLKSGDCCFKFDIPDVVDSDMLNVKKIELVSEFNRTKLPSVVNQEPFREFLYNFRMRMLKTEFDKFSMFYKGL